MVNVPYTSPTLNGSTSANANTHHYMAFGTHSKLLDLVQHPLDGNPHRHMGLIAHPSAITGLATSYFARYLYSSVWLLARRIYII